MAVKFEPAPEIATIDSELRSLDLQRLDVMRRLEVGTSAEWMRLIDCAVRLGLSLKDIAGFLPCSVSTVSRWQSGKTAPPVFMREPLKKVLIRLAEHRLNATGDARAAEEGADEADRLGTIELN